MLVYNHTFLFGFYMFLLGPVFILQRPWWGKTRDVPMISQAISRRCPGLALLPWPGKSMGNGGTKCTFTDLHGEIIWKWYGFSGQKNQAQATPANTGGYLQTGHCSIANIQYTGMIIVCLSVLHGIILGVCAFHHPERDSFFFYRYCTHFHGGSTVTCSAAMLPRW